MFDGEVESLISGMNMNIPDEVKKELSFDEDVINLTKKKISSLSDGVIGKPLTIDTSRISRYKYHFYKIHSLYKLFIVVLVTLYI